MGHQQVIVVKRQNGIHIPASASGAVVAARKPTASSEE
jgi:hypothetical protein